MRPCLSCAVLFLAILCGVSCRTPRSRVEAGAEERALLMAETRGWLTELKRGRAILQELSALSGAKLENTPIAAYGGQRVAFIGTGMWEHDLFTVKGFYLRLLTPAGRDLRPQTGMWYEVLVRGRILGVLAKNRIIVIEVNENDWQLVQTG